MNSPNKGSKVLYDLIRSLNRSEKRYFKMYNSRNVLAENGVNEKLFNAIDKQDLFNESAIKVFFKDEAFIKNFSVAKTRLQKMIMGSLRSFHANKTTKNTLLIYLNEIEILFQKGLFVACEKTINKAKKLAEDKTRRTELLLLIEWEIQLLEKKKYETSGANAIFEKMSVYQENIIALDQYAQLVKLKSELFQNIYQGNTIKLSENKELLHQINTLDRSEIKDQRSKLIYFQLMSAKEYALENFNSSLSFSEEILNISDLHDRELNISVLGNIIYLAIQLKQFDKAKTHLFMLKHMEQNEKALKNDAFLPILFQNISSLEILLRSEEKKIDQALELVPSIATRLGHYNGQISPIKRASFYLNFAQLQILKGNLKEALKWNNTLLNYKKLDKNEGIYSHTLMLDLLIHSELENNDLVLNKLKPVERYLQNSGLLGSFEKLFLSNMRSIAKKKADLKKWRSDIQKIEKSELNSSLIQKFNFLLWIESKIENKNMVDLL